MVRNHIVTIRLDDAEYEMVKRYAEMLDVSVSEVFRRAIYTVDILFNPYLPVREALMDKVVDENTSLSDILKPLPELMRIITKEIKKREKLTNKTLNK